MSVWLLTLGLGSERIKVRLGGSQNNQGWDLGVSRLWDSETQDRRIHSAPSLADDKRHLRLSDNLILADLRLGLMQPCSHEWGIWKRRAAKDKRLGLVARIM